MTIQIRHKHTRAVLYANISATSLRGVYLHGTSLSGADLRGADLRGADMALSNLTNANLHGAILRGADLRNANLSGANLGGANLTAADLRLARLAGANMLSADLHDADLTGANLAGVQIDPLASAMHSIVPESGSFEGWKQCRDNVLVQLRIPAESRRSNATGRQCRAEFVEVLDVVGGEVGVSIFDEGTTYRTGETVRCHEWDADRWKEFAGGIGFYLSRVEAEHHF